MCGKPQARRFRPHSRRGYPRARGEFVSRPSNWGWACGSPPRLRGAKSIHPLVKNFPRITPCIRGERAVPESSYSLLTDHPRVRGEHPVDSKMPVVRARSPQCADSNSTPATLYQRRHQITPRVRGACHVLGVPPGRERITPACTGSMAPARLPLGTGWDHPRACGSTTGWPRTRPSAADHPRACGDHGSSGSSGSPHAGSPPRVRGPLLIGHRDVLTPRITPARAGNTSARGSPRPAGTDHPRASEKHGLSPSA